MNKKNKEDKNKKVLISIVILLIILIIALFVAVYVAQSNKEDEKTLAYTDLIKEVSYGNIEKVEMTVGSTTVKVKMKNEEEEKLLLYQTQKVLLH